MKKTTNINDNISEFPYPKKKRIDTKQRFDDYNDVDYYLFPQLEWVKLNHYH